MPPTAFLVITSFARAAWQVPITERPQLLGRGSDAEVPIPAEFTFVSRRHAEVWADAGGLWLRDLSSTGGSCVNGVRVEPERQTRIAIGDRLNLGGLELQIVAAVAPADADAQAGRKQATDSARAAPAPRPRAPLTLDRLIQDLSRDERDIVRRMLRGDTTVDALARALSRDPAEVRIQLERISHALGVRSRDDLLALLLRAAAAYSDSRKTLRSPD